MTSFPLLQHVTCAPDKYLVLLYVMWVLLKTGTEKLDIGNVEMGNRKRGKEHVRDQYGRTTPYSQSAPRLNRLREVRHTVVACSLACP